MKFGDAKILGDELILIYIGFSPMLLVLSLVYTNNKSALKSVQVYFKYLSERPCTLYISSIWYVC